MILFIYIVAASHAPDIVVCVVPYLIDEDLIFFGPCKKRLREWLSHRYLNGVDDAIPEDDIFVVGVNGNNKQRIRKILWAGWIARVMTFEAAYNNLNGPNFQDMRCHDFSPLHVKPLYDRAGEFLGYEHISREHEREDNWVLDFTDRHSSPYFIRKGTQLLIKPNTGRSQAFPRDCCFLCDNIFYAQGAGIPITDKILAVLTGVQPGKEIDPYAIFGYRVDGSIEGLTGRHLSISGESAQELIDLIRDNKPVAQGTTKHQLKPCNCR
jgi:hypothetical protein